MSYWDQLIEAILAMPSDTRKTSKGSSSSGGAAGKTSRDGPHDIIRRLVDQLVAFSSLQMVPIRDAITEAALCVGKVRIV